MSIRKKAARILSFLLLCAIVCTLTACSTKLSGTYARTEGFIKQTFTFTEDSDVVKVSAFGIDVNGTYVVEDEIITITYSLGNLSYDWEASFSRDGDSIFIDGTEFIKESD